MKKLLVVAARFAARSLSAPSLAHKPSRIRRKPVKFIVPGAAGRRRRRDGAHDRRASAEQSLGQPFVVENRPGAGSAIGMQALAKSPPDGYTIGLGNIAANAINPAVQPDNKLYDPVKDFAPISLVGVTPLVLVVNAEKVPSKTLPEFIAYLKANPGQAVVRLVGQRLVAAHRRWSSSC